MQNTITPTTQKATVIQVLTRTADDGSLEIITDAMNAYEDRAILKGQGFTFIKDRSAGLGIEAPLDRNGLRSKAPAWRKIFAIIPVHTPQEKYLETLGSVVDDIVGFLRLLPDYRLKGASAASHKIQAIWPDEPEVDKLLERFKALDTPWRPDTESEPKIAITPED